MSVITTADIDMNFGLSIKGDIAKVVGLNCIMQSLRNCVMVENRPFNLNWGPGIYTMLFEGFDPVALVMMENDILYNIRLHEKRISNVSLKTNIDHNLGILTISIFFTLLNSKQIESLSVVLEKVR